MPQSKLSKTSLRQRRSQPGARVASQPTQDTALGTMAMVLFALGMIASLWLG
ncbi:MAG: hypothetical protein VXX15_02820 [Planctomycetota bacterium]|nr:hypothetical protein [Planctomycetota bacterium]MED5322224.1 hypothetical protein [Planctomycetota bacterium]